MEVLDEGFDYDTEAKIAFIEDEINNLEWYDKQMVKLYFEEGMSYQKISEFTNIPKTSCYNSITQIKNKIKSKYDGSK